MRSDRISSDVLGKFLYCTASGDVNVFLKSYSKCFRVVLGMITHNNHRSIIDNLSENGESNEKTFSNFLSPALVSLHYTQLIKTNKTRQQSKSSCCRKLFIIFNIDE